MPQNCVSRTPQEIEEIVEMDLFLKQETKSFKNGFITIQRFIMHYNAL
jgi:hypothetical protein